MITTARPSLAAQAARLIDLGLHERAGVPAEALRQAADGAAMPDAVLVLHPDAVRPSELVPLVEVAGRRGFVVADMQDLDAFLPIEDAQPPAGLAYALRAPERGDEMRNWSPDEALPALRGAGRTPLTVAEGLHWVLQQPDVLERNRCFMTIGSRLRKPSGALDARTPALWFSNGTGRDGSERRHCPKVGWCWAGNRHTWLGFASAASREVLLESPQRK